MKYMFMTLLLTSLCAGNDCNAQAQSLNQTSLLKIKHTVVFRFKQPMDSTELKAFFKAARKLANIPGVQNFESLKQISKKNNFEYGLSMEFSSQQSYDQYLNHPDHVSFVKEFWLKDVADFMEIDYKPLM